MVYAHDVGLACKHQGCNFRSSIGTSLKDHIANSHTEHETITADPLPEAMPARAEERQQEQEQPKQDSKTDDQQQTPKQVQEPQTQSKRKQTFEDVRREAKSNDSPKLFLDKAADFLSELKSTQSKVDGQSSKPSANVQESKGRGRGRPPKDPSAEVAPVPETVDILDDEDDNEVASQQKLLKCTANKGGFRCHYEASNQQALNKHLLNSHNIERFRCSECPFNTGLFTELQKHIKSTHNHEECHNCGFAATQRAVMDDHMSRCKFVRCDKCDHSAPDHSHLVNHLKAVHDIIR